MVGTAPMVDLNSGAPCCDIYSKRRRGAQEVVQERKQIVACFNDNWKAMDHVPGSWLVANGYVFLLRHHCRTGLSDQEFAGVSEVLPRTNSFNVNGFTLDKLPWRFKELHSNGVTPNLGEEVINHIIFWWLSR